MRRLGSTMAAAMLVGLCASAGGGAAPAPRTIELTTGQNGKDVAVRAGDELVLLLPQQMPLWWAAHGETPGLRQQARPVFREWPNAVPKALGRSKCQVMRYRVEAEASGQSVEWIYCKLGKTRENGEEIRPGELLKMDEVPQRGSLFRVRLVAEAASR